MAISKETKGQFIEKMKTDLGRAQSVLFVDFTGMTVEEADSLRCKMREADVGYQVVKNTLMTRVIAGTPYEDAGQWLKGSPTGVLLGFEDPTSAARITFEFMKDCAHIKVKGGILDDKAITQQDAEALSKLPSRTEMQGQIVSLALGVAGNLINQFKGPGGRIAGAVESKAKEDEAA